MLSDLLQRKFPTSLCCPGITGVLNVRERASCSVNSFALNSEDAGSYPFMLSVRHFRPVAAKAGNTFGQYQIAHNCQQGGQGIDHNSTPIDEVRVCWHWPAHQ